MSQEVKNLFRGQSKYGLMGSSAKTGKKFFCGSQEQFLDKTVIWDRTPRSYTSNAVYVWGRAQGSQIFKWNSIISIRSKVIVILPIWVSLALGGGAGGWGVPGVISYSLYEFRNVQR